MAAVRFPAAWSRRIRQAADAPAVAFVFSGGGSLGASQVGAARALLEAGIRPDLMVGCSVGALSAAFLAASPSAEAAAELEAVSRGVPARDVFGSGRHRTLGRLVLGRDHVADPEALRSLIRRFSPISDLSDTAVPCHVVTTDLVSGQPAVWSRGPAIDVLSASACLPGLFPPVELVYPDGVVSLHVDGGVLLPVPSSVALSLRARTVYVLDVSDGHSASHVEPGGLSALGVLLRSFAVARAALQEATAPRPSSDQQVIEVPHPPTSGIDIRDFSHTSELLEGGYRLAHQFLEARAANHEARPGDARPHRVPLRRRLRPALAPTVEPAASPAA